MPDHRPARRRSVPSLGFDARPVPAPAIDALLAGRSVLVAAPTGAGKTVVGEFACHEALRTRRARVLHHARSRPCPTRSTATSCGPTARTESACSPATAPSTATRRIVVMTTEVLRNMIYEASPALDGPPVGRARRGALPRRPVPRRGVGGGHHPARPAGASSPRCRRPSRNAEDVGRWLDQVRGRDGGLGCEVVIEEHRPVPLRHHYFVNDTVYDTFRAGRKGGATREHRERASQALAGVPNPDVVMLERRARTRNRVSGKGRRHGPGRAAAVAEPAAGRRGARRPSAGCPAILFVFSRQGCEDAVSQLLQAGVRLTDRRSRRRDRRHRRLDGRRPAGAPTCGSSASPAGGRGCSTAIAAHHAGMVPAFKEVVEVLFQRGLLGVVVATETLALGINMPARTVVIERLEKWNGESHVLLTPGEYTQLTGRAGRRGIDRVGHAVVLYQRDLDFRTVAGLVGTRTYPLHSSFAPSYNMAVNLLRRHDLRRGRGAARRVVRAVRGRRVGRTDRPRGSAELEEGKAGYAQHLTCELGDWPAYWAMRREVSRREKREAKERRRADDRPGPRRHRRVCTRRRPAPAVARQARAGRGRRRPPDQEGHADRPAGRRRPVADQARPTRARVAARPGRARPAPGQRATRDRPPTGATSRSALRAARPARTRRHDPAERTRSRRTGPSAEVVAAARGDPRPTPATPARTGADHERWQHRYDELDDEVAAAAPEGQRARPATSSASSTASSPSSTELGYVSEPDRPADHGGGGRTPNRPMRDARSPASTARSTCWSPRPCAAACSTTSNRRSSPASPRCSSTRRAAGTRPRIPSCRRCASTRSPRSCSTSPTSCAAANAQPASARCATSTPGSSRRPGAGRAAPTSTPRSVGSS